MPTLEVEFECYCGDCGAGICRNVAVKGHTLTIEPCKRCLEEAEHRGKHEHDYEVERLEAEVAELEAKLEAAEEKEEE